MHFNNGIEICSFIGIARKSICFSKNKDIHQTVIGSFINIFFWERSLPNFN
ncbi:MAG: IS1 family transposase [Oscillospiraceae bacterium]